MKRMISVANHSPIEKRGETGCCVLRGFHGQVDQGASHTEEFHFKAIENIRENREIEILQECRN